MSYLSSSFYYIEPDDGQLGTGYIDSEKGNLKGARAALSLLLFGKLYVRAAYSGTEGKENYDGVAAGVPVNETSRATMQEGDARLGLAFAGDRTWILVPYLEAGRRYWVRVVGLYTPGSDVSSYGFDYYGFGSLAQYAPSENWVITGDASFGSTFAATVNDPGFGLNRTALGSAPIARLGAEVDGRLYGHLHFFIGADYLYYSFDPSAVQASGFAQHYGYTTLYNATLGLRLAY